MKQIRFWALLLIAGLFVIACSSGSSDDGGTTGGSGETETSAAASTDSSSNDESTSAADSSDSNTSSTAPDTPASSSDIWLDAYTFNCTSNWTNRDGPLGLAAYSGSGTCSKAFPGETGTYQLTLYAVTEFDGKSPYKVSIDGSTIKEGTYPLSSPLGCDCPIETWRTVCPDKSLNINLGTHTITQGASIGFWGDDVYPCGEHGSYTKWYGIRATKK